MEIRLTTRIEELLKRQLAHQEFHSPEEVIERALEALAEKQSASTGDGQRDSVRDMLDFCKKNRIRLAAGLSAKDLIHEGHSV